MLASYKIRYIASLFLGRSLSTKPILTYGCEIWASIGNPYFVIRSADNNYIFDSVYQSFHGEKLHTKFCKYVLLGVHSKASNFACVGEVGRCPIYIDFCNDILKYYFLCFSQKIDDSLIGQTLKASKNFYYIPSYEI